MIKNNYLKRPDKRPNAPDMKMSVSLHESTQDKLASQIVDTMLNLQRIQVLLDEQSEVLEELRETIMSITE